MSSINSGSSSAVTAPPLGGTAGADSRPKVVFVIGATGTGKTKVSRWALHAAPAVSLSHVDTVHD